VNERRHSDSTEKSLIASVLIGGQEQWWALHELSSEAFYEIGRASCRERVYRLV